MLTQISPMRTPFRGGKMGPICLITPPSLVLSDERVIPHLGILKVGSAIREHNIHFDSVDLSGVRDYPDAIGAYMNGEGSETKIFGITATSPQLPAALRVLKIIRSHNEKARVILGGPHVTLVNAAYRQEAEKNTPGRAYRMLEHLSQLFDVLIAGDGEKALPFSLENPSMKVVDADNTRSDLFLQKYDLDKMPFPARDAIKLESYKYSIGGVPATSMIAQLGCPFGCGFCGGRESDFLRRVRLRSTESVIAEMRHIYERYGFRGIMFYDDELNVNKKVIELMEAIARLGEELKIEWRLRGFVKAELFTKPQAVAMYRAGFREILVGFESGSPAILKNIQKRATKEDNTRCVEIARQAGLRVKALMSMGHPGENEHTVRETEDWILSIQPESFDLTRITVYPGTPYFDHALPHQSLHGVWTYSINGDRLYSHEVDYTKQFLFYKGDRGDREGLNSLSTFTDYLSAEDLANLRKETEDRLREKLGQPYQVDVPGIQFESSMGMGLPDYILRST